MYETVINRYPEKEREWNSKMSSVCLELQLDARMDQGFLLKCLQKATFTCCYICISQLYCCRRQERVEWNEHGWNKNQSRPTAGTSDTRRLTERRYLPTLNLTMLNTPQYNTYLHIIYVLLFAMVIQYSDSP